MNIHLSNGMAELPGEPSAAISLSRPGQIASHPGASLSQQRGVVLFFTLVALLAMSLAAVALIRSVDTGGMIVGNLAFKQATTSAADSGIAEAMTMMAGVTAESKALGMKIEHDVAHPLNNTTLSSVPGYHATYDPNFVVTDPDNWNSSKSVLVGADESGHEVRYLIQRLCRDSGVELTKNDCLVGAIISENGSIAVLPYTEYCPKELDCADEGQPAQMLITVKSQGLNKSTSYVQGIVY